MILSYLITFSSWANAVSLLSGGRTKGDLKPVYEVVEQMEYSFKGFCRHGILCYLEDTGRAFKETFGAIIIDSHNNKVYQGNPNGINMFLWEQMALNFATDLQDSCHLADPVGYITIGGNKVLNPFSEAVHQFCQGKLNHENFQSAWWSVVGYEHDKVFDLLMESIEESTFESDRKKVFSFYKNLILNPVLILE